MPSSVAFITLGCAKNEVDTADMQKLLLEAGYQLTNDYDNADVIIINTCSFIQPAIEESIDTIFEALSLESVSNGSTKLVVAGCMPARFGDDLATELTEPDAFLPCADEHTVVDVVNSLLGNNNAPETLSVTLEQGPSAYLKISDGCSRKCSYCTIPFIRGPYHSFPLDDIVKNAQELVDGGARELVLIAQDSGLWGRDFDQPDTLAHLLEVLAQTFPNTWLRVLYLQPSGVTDELLSVMKRYDTICNYFDIPLQHCDEAILRSMNRKGSKRAYLDLISRIRSVLPDVVLRTTLIVGYPGETEEQFEGLCDFLSEAEFDYAGAFAFSPEDGTVAATLPDQVDEDIKTDRLQVIRDLADSISSQKIAERQSMTVPVLILGTEEDGQIFGRTQQQAPDVDGVTYVDEGSLGEIAPYLITDTLLYEMEAERV